MKWESIFWFCVEDNYYSIIYLIFYSLLLYVIHLTSIYQTLPHLPGNVVSNRVQKSEQAMKGLCSPGVPCRWEDRAAKSLAGTQRRKQLKFQLVFFFAVFCLFNCYFNWFLADCQRCAGCWTGMGIACSDWSSH